MHISYEFGSPNYDERPDGASIDFIILHYTDMLFDEALTKLCDPLAKVSCHYLIKEDGKIFQLVNDKMRAWHAGKSCWQGREAFNDFSIGIEIDNLGLGPFTDLQMESCIYLCKTLASKYKIPAQNVIGHSDIAPSRKLDPGIYFDWKKLAGHGLGIWGNNDPSLHKEVSDKVMTDAQVKSVQTRLAAIGYDLDITGEWDDHTNSVIRAFQAHFCPGALIKQGVEFYRDMSSRYLWNEELEEVLSNLQKSNLNHTN